MSDSTRIFEAVFAIKPIFSLGHGGYLSLVGFLSQIFQQGRYDEMILWKLLNEYLG